MEDKTRINVGYVISAVSAMLPGGRAAAHAVLGPLSTSAAVAVCGIL